MAMAFQNVYDITPLSKAQPKQAFLPVTGRDLGRGLAYLSVGVVYTNFDGLTGVTNIDFDDPGVSAGLGYDFQINENWVVGGEYQWHSFTDFGGPNNDVTFNTIHIRAAYRF